MSARAHTWAVVVAAGWGSRFGGAKQYEFLGGRRVVDHALASARAACGGVVLVVPSARVEDREPAADIVVAGGATRSGSVRAGLAAVPEEAAVIVVHDAARPVASLELWERVIGPIDGVADAAIPVVPVTDTLRELGGGTVDRSRFVLVQTPQAFAAASLRAAHHGEPEASDDASLVEAAGGRVVTVEGDPRNIKVTSRADLRAVQAALPGPVLRIGQGFDLHPFATSGAGGVLVMGGVRFPGERALAGHSDSDVVAHAITDALLSAAGLGDIGQRFPDDDPATAGADSVEMLRRAVADIASAGWAPVNVDCTVVADAPAIAPHRAQMQDRLSDAVGAPVTLKGTRAEGVGALGRREGIACLAVALLSGAAGPPGSGDAP